MSGVMAGQSPLPPAVEAAKPPRGPGGGWPMDVSVAAAATTAQVLRAVGTTADGLAAAEAARRLTAAGPNAVRTHQARLLPVLGRQLRSPLLLLLLAVTAAASYFVGERSDALIIGIILAASVGLGFANEYRAEKAAEALHSQLHHRCVTHRDGIPGRST